MIPAAHELQYAPALALRPRILQVGLAMAQTLEEEWEFHGRPCRAAVARANCHQFRTRPSATVSRGTNPQGLRTFEPATPWQTLLAVAVAAKG